MAFHQSQHPYWTPRRQRNFWRKYSKLSPKARGWLIDAEAGWPQPALSAHEGGEKPSEHDLALARAKRPVQPGTCWNCGKAPRGLCCCINCGAEQPVGQWYFPAICWPPFDPNNPVLAFGAVGFRYGEHFLNYDFVITEYDTERRRTLSAMMARDASAKRKANSEFHGQALQGLLAEWRARYGRSERR